MASTIICDPPTPGFSFENCKRNELLADKGFCAPQAMKTGTTICGVIFKDGIVLGADTRATNGDIVADKKCQKIHHAAPNMLCCGAGTAADCDKMTNLLRSQLTLHRLNTGRQCRVITASRMLTQRLFQYQGHIGAYLILGGVDVTGSHLKMISANGYATKMPYCAMGSGMLGALSVLDSRFKENMTEEEAKNLVHDAILGGIFNDMGSGSNVDLAVIKANDNIQYFRPYDVANKKGERKNKYRYPAGSTGILKSVERPVIVESSSVRTVEAMEQ